MFKAIFTFTILSFICVVQARTLPVDNFLYPRSWEAMSLAGLEYNYKIKNIAYQRRDCDETQVFLCEITQKVQESDFSEQIDIEDRDLLYIGERHLDQAPKKWVVDLIKEHKGKFSVLALEMFNSSSQKDLDRYFVDEIGDDDIKEILEGQWGYKSAGYMEMIRTAKSNGIRIIGIDHRDTVKELNLSFSDELIHRDLLMAKVINQELARGPYGKMIIYTGKLHAFRSLGEDIITVADYVRKENPTHKAAHYLSFNLKSKNFITDLYKFLFNDIRKIDGDILSLSTLRPYADGIFFFED